MTRGLPGLVLLVLVVWPVDVAAQRSPTRGLHADRLDVSLTLEPDGALHVEETITFRFTDRTFREVERRVPIRRVDGLTQIEALMDGVVVPDGTDAGEARIRQGRRELRVLWHFARTTDVSHQFTLRYRAANVLFLDSGRASLAWHVLPTRHRYGISQAEVRWTVPSGAISNAGPALEAEGWTWTREQGDGASEVWVARKSNLAVDETAILTDEFDAASLAVTTPQWQFDEDRAHHFAPAFLVGAGVILVMGGGIILMTLVRYPRPRIEGSTIVAAAHGSWPPALATAILSNRPRVSWAQQSATVFDLLARGLLTVRDTTTADTGAKSRTFDLTTGHRSHAPASLRPHERLVMDTLATHMTDGRIALTAAKTRLAAAQGTFADAVQVELREAGLVDPDRQAAAKGLTTAGIIALLLGLAGVLVFALGLPWLGGAALLVPGATGLVGLACIIAGESAPVFSQSGAILRAQWVARARQLRAESKRPLTTECLDHWLPVLMGLGISRAVTAGGSSAAWLQGVPHPEAALIAIIASAGPKTSSGAGGASVGGGGIAGGGGFSGAR